MVFSMVPGGIPLYCHPVITACPPSRLMALLCCEEKSFSEGLMKEDLINCGS